MMRGRWATRFLAILAIAAAVVPAPAREGPKREAAKAIVLAAAGMSLDQAVAMVERKYRARVVRAEVREEKGRKVYVLRLLNESGRVWTVRVDAASGAML